MEVKSTQHNMNPFEVCNSVAVSNFLALHTHHFTSPKALSLSSSLGPWHPRMCILPPQLHLVCMLHTDAIVLNYVTSEPGFFP